MAIAFQKKLDRLTFLDPDKAGGSMAAALEIAVAEAKHGANIVYAKSVINLHGMNDVQRKADSLYLRELVALTTVKVSESPPLYHYIAQRTKKPYVRPEKGGGK